MGAGIISLYSVEALAVNSVHGPLHVITVIDLLSALCAKLFQNGGKFFKYFFFLLSAHFNKLLYIKGNEFKG